MSSLIIPDRNLINAPPCWAKVDALLGRYEEPVAFGFVGPARDMNRFKSRYRLAKSFRSISLESFTAETVQGYSSLFRVFLVYSAFEQFMRVSGASLQALENKLGSYSPEELAKAIRAVPNHVQFLLAVLHEVKGDYIIKHGFNFVTGNPCNVLVLPAAIRHIFAHGKLTPHSGADSTEPATALSSLFCKFLFDVMDGEFVQRLRDNGVAV